MAQHQKFKNHTQEETKLVYKEVIEEVILQSELESVLDVDTLNEIRDSWIDYIDIIAKEDEKKFRDKKKLPKNKKKKNLDDEEESDYANYLMSFHDKVTRVKTKWKCNFKRGFINVGGKDYPFNTAYGDLEWEYEEENKK